MQEKRKMIEEYEDLYEVTETGRIISLREQRPLARCKDEYGFHIVSLTNKEGGKKNHNVFELWQKAFPENQDRKSFKGALKAKYGTGCVLLNRKGVHFE